jgi:5-methylcytosine-specific restriction endonuclease McrA
MSSGINSEQKRAMRVNTHARYGGRCAYCDAFAPMRSGTVDHYLPRALGGGNELANLRWACKPCNEAKADMPPEEWEQRKPERQRRPLSRLEQKIALHQVIAQRRRAMEQLNPGR